MNLFKSVALFALAASVFAPAFGEACPDLAGTHRCSAMGFAVNIPVTQSTNIKGVTTYVIDGGPIVTDGTQRTMNPMPKILSLFARDVVYRATCQGAAISFAGDGTNNKGKRVQVQGTLTRVSGGLTVNMVVDGRAIQANCQSSHFFTSTPASIEPEFEQD